MIEKFLNKKKHVNILKIGIKYEYGLKRESIIYIAV